LSPLARFAAFARSLSFGLLALHLWTVFSIAISNVLLGLATLSSPVDAWRGLRRARRWLVLPGVYVLGLGISIALSQSPRQSLSAAAESFNLLTFLLAVCLVTDRHRARRIIDGLGIAGALFALAGLGQYLMGWGDLERRIRGPFSHYMTFSGALLLCSLLLLARMTVAGKWRSPWRWTAFLLMQWGLWGSLTRSAWIAAAAGITVVLALRLPRMLWSFLPASVLFLTLAPVPWVARALSIASPAADDSAYDRLCMARAGLRMVAERPMFGIGPQLVKHRYGLYREETAPRFEVPHLHNAFLQIAAERGVFSLLAFLAWLGWTGWVALRALRREGWARGPRSDLWLGTLAALAGLAVAGLFENNWGDTEVQRVALFVLAVPAVLDHEASEA
jgi:O-antigen ligase